jgi:dihydrofolate synthase/folylpolyglutamate synthase
LGETLPEIAFEKAGIIKHKIPVIIGEEQAAVKQVFLKKAEAENAPIYFASDTVKTFKTDLLGNYQLRNLKTAVAAIKLLKGFQVSEQNMENGLLNVVKNTNLKGRWQVLQENPKVICDTAHNKEGLEMVLQQLKKEAFKKLHIVLGFVSDKKLEDVLPLFPNNASYYFCKPDIPRGLSAVVLQEKAIPFDLIGEKYTSVKEALNSALLNANQQDIIYVGGSTFVVAEII